MSNTWPGGRRRALTQDEHARWNAEHYPGTRQLCIECGEPTGRCEDDELLVDGHGPLCEACESRLQAPTTTPDEAAGPHHQHRRAGTDGGNPR